MERTGFSHECLGGEYMFYSAEQGSIDERVNGAIPLEALALDVDLDATRSDINFLSPEIIFRYQIQDDSLVSRVCGTMAVPGRIQRDWDESDLWFACVSDGADTVVVVGKFKADVAGIVLDTNGMAGINYRPDFFVLVLDSAISRR